MSTVKALLAARANPADRPAGLLMPPVDEAAAYAVQAEIMAQLGPIGGWKVDYNPGSGAFTCAPIPARLILQSPATIAQADTPDRGVEAEIALLLGQDMPPREAPYTDDDAKAAIASAHPAIEPLQSRYIDVTQVDARSNLADSLSNHGLVCGPAIPAWTHVDYAAESVAVIVDGTELKRCTANPAGPMLPLVAWLASTGAVWAGGLKAGQWVTTGSWTQKDFVPEGATVVMRFQTCGSVEVTYT